MRAGKFDPIMSLCVCQIMLINSWFVNRWHQFNPTFINNWSTWFVICKPFFYVVNSSLHLWHPTSNKNRWQPTSRLPCFPGIQPNFDLKWISDAITSYLLDSPVLWKVETYGDLWIHLWPVSSGWFIRGLSLQWISSASARFVRVVHVPWFRDGPHEVVEDRYVKRYVPKSNQSDGFEWGFTMLFVYLFNIIYNYSQYLDSRWIFYIVDFSVRFTMQTMRNVM